MLKNLELNKMLWIILAILSFFASAVGVFFQSIYDRVTTFDILPGTISQDLVTMILSVVLLVLALKITDREAKKQIFAISIIGYLFYGYGIWAIEQMYTPLYLLYLAIFALSFWTLIVNIFSVRNDSIINLSLMSENTRRIAIGVSIFTAVLFYLLWAAQLVPLMQTGNKIEFMYSIYILDMCFVLPAFLICAYMVIRRYNLGLVLLPILFVKGFTLLFSVGLGGLLRPFYNMPIPGETWFYLGMSAMYLAITMLFLRNLRTGNLANSQA